jgi:hypothetical protein
MTPQEHELIHDYLHERLAPGRGAELTALLERSAEARELLRTEAAIEMHLRELSTSESLATVARPTRVAANRSRGWLAPIAAGIVLGVMLATATWASVTALRREPDPVTLSVANGDFETLGEMKVGGYPKMPGHWRGDAAECVGATAEVRPHSGNGMLRFLRPDGRNASDTRGFTACDQWQLLDLSKVPTTGDAEQWVAEADVWFNGLATARQSDNFCQLTVYAIDVQHPKELNSISSVWLRQSGAVLAVGNRRIVRDADPATWERAAVTLPLPARTKFLLIHLFAGAPPDTTGTTPFPGPFADSASMKLRRVPSVEEVLTAK